MRNPQQIFMASAILLLSISACQNETKKEAATPTVSAVIQNPPVVAVADSSLSGATEAGFENRVADEAARSPESAAAVEKYLSAMKPATQHFRVDAGEGTELVARSGTRIALPAQCFEDEAGNRIHGPVEFRVTEYGDPVEILSARLQTKSGTKLLETGGMLYMDASAGGKPLRLRAGSTATIAFPKAAGKKDMQLFRGVNNGARIDWIPLDNSVPAETPALFRKARFGEGDDAVTTYLLHKIDMNEALSIDNKMQFRMRLAISSTGKATLIDISPAPPQSLLRSFSRAIAQMAAWTAGARLGVPVKDTAVTMLGFEWSTGSRDAQQDFSARDETETYTSADQNREQQYAILQSTGLGWVNCDRFLDNSRERVEFFVKTEVPGEELALICHSVNSFISGTPVRGGYIFSGVPNGEVVTVIGFRYTGNGLCTGLATMQASRRQAAALQYHRNNVHDFEAAIHDALSTSIAVR